jgi:hypothetical protein
LDAKLIIKRVFWSGLLGAAQQNLMIDDFGAVTWLCPYLAWVLVIKTGSSCKAGLIAGLLEEMTTDKKMWHYY